jgi:hypothetical protein
MWTIQSSTWRLTSTTCSWTATPLATADFDADGDVDGNDLATHRTASFGASAGGDADGDGDSDGADFLAWQRQFGGAPAMPVGEAVPEPSTAPLLIVTISIAPTALRRRD